MARKHKFDYFDAFVKIGEYAVEYANELVKYMEKNAQIVAEGREPDIAHAIQRYEELHKIEEASDDLRHSIVDALSTEFLAPIEREDIMMLSQNIDDVTDCIEDVLLRIYINNVIRIRRDALPFADLIISCCETLLDTLREFADFRKSPTLNEKLIAINTLEEEADKLFISSMHALHTESDSALEIIAWREIYTYMEKCADACEHVADVIEEIVMKNS